MSSATIAIKQRREARKLSDPQGPKSFYSWPLFKQSIKSNWVLWLVLAAGSAMIFVIINLVVGTRTIFTNIDMAVVQQYMQDEGLSWLQVLGLLEKMGFSLARLQIMSQLDLNAIMNDLIYKIAGVLLPMIYVMIIANRLLASQVNDGSMAYVLSTPTNRRKVVRTQYLFLLLSLIAMYLVIMIGAMGSGAIAVAIRNAKPAAAQEFFSTFFLRTFLYCLASFLAIFGLSGVCFCASAVMNKSSRSIAIGGGACVCAFLFCILGLFGNKIFVSVGVGVEAMNFFNYMTIFSLINTDSMSSFAKAVTGVDAEISFTWIWELAVLLIMGGGLSAIGSIYFTKKDLPL